MDLALLELQQLQDYSPPPPGIRLLSSAQHFARYSTLSGNLLRFSRLRVSHPEILIIHVAVVLPSSPMMKDECSWQTVNDPLLPSFCVCFNAQRYHMSDVQAQHGHGFAPV